MASGTPKRSVLILSAGPGVAVEVARADAEGCADARGHKPSGTFRGALEIARVGSAPGPKG